MIFKYWFFTCLIIVFFDCAICQVPASGKCPDNINTVSNFNVDKYLGKWYEYAKYPFRYEIGGRCMYAIYGKYENGTISVLNTQIKKSTGKRSSTSGIAETTDESGKILVKFPSTRPSHVKSNYWVLGTDYTTYVVVYSCSGNMSSHSTVVWILTRSRTPPTESIKAAHDLMDLNGLSKSDLTLTDQSDCPEDDH